LVGGPEGTVEEVTDDLPVKGSTGIGVGVGTSQGDSNGATNLENPQRMVDKGKSGIGV